METKPKITICYSFKDMERAKKEGMGEIQTFEFDIDEMPEADILFDDLKHAGGNLSYWVAGRFVRGYSPDYIWN
jgi:hypothetical protein